MTQRIKSSYKCNQCANVDLDKTIITFDSSGQCYRNCLICGYKVKQETK